jgi:hypothetical protein
VSRQVQNVIYPSFLEIELLKSVCPRGVPDEGISDMYASWTLDSWLLDAFSIAEPSWMMMKALLGCMRV